jgi:hypothetical protein
MDLELKTLGQTLAVGGFAVYATLLLVRICRAEWVPRFFSSEDGKLQLQHTAVYLALVFAAGIILEDVSKNYAARRTTFLSSVFNEVLDSDNELRLRSLFKDVTLTDSKIELTPRPILRELQHLTPPHKAVEPHFKTINDFISPLAAVPVPLPLAIDTKKAVSDFRAAVDGVFYDAKNLVYRDDNYYKELNEISTRIDFTRSLTFLCLVFSFIYLLFTVFGFIPKMRTFFDIDRKERKTLIVLTVLYGLGIWLSGTAYRSEQTHYNLRVYGYYISLGLAEKSESPNTAAQATASSSGR